MFLFPPAYSRSYVSFIFHEPLEDNSVGSAEMVLIILIMKEYFKYLHAIGDVFTMISSYSGLLVPIRMTSRGKWNMSERFFCHTAAAPRRIFVVKAVKPIQRWFAATVSVFIETSSASLDAFYKYNAFGIFFLHWNCFWTLKSMGKNCTYIFF